jgi:hypothetical protein
MKLIVLAAFDKDDGTGELRPAFGAREMRDEDQARRQARMIKDQHTGVIAWSRDAQPDIGEFGPPDILVVYGEVPEME